jgi:hypothetical protein
MPTISDAPGLGVPALPPLSGGAGIQPAGLRADVSALGRYTRHMPAGEHAERCALRSRLRSRSGGLQASGAFLRLLSSGGPGTAGNAMIFAPIGAVNIDRNTKPAGYRHNNSQAHFSLQIRRASSILVHRPFTQPYQWLNAQLPDISAIPCTRLF